MMTDDDARIVHAAAVPLASPPSHHLSSAFHSSPPVGPHSAAVSARLAVPPISPHSSHHDGGLTARKVYVENLPLPTSESVLSELFAPFGSILRIHIGIDKANGRQLGFAFVEFREEHMGQAAIAAMSGREMNGRAIRCSIARKRTRSDANRDGADARQRQQQQQQQQQQQPQQVQGALMMFPVMGPNGQMMMAPIMSMGGVGAGASNGSLLGTPPSHREPASPNPTLFLSGLPLSWFEGDLHAFFSPFGTILHVKVLLDSRTGESRGQGFVQFETTNSAINAVAAFSGQMANGTDTGMQVKFAYPKKGADASAQQAHSLQMDHSTTHERRPSAATSSSQAHLTLDDSPPVPNRKSRSHSVGYRPPSIARDAAAAVVAAIADAPAPADTVAAAPANSEASAPDLTLHKPEIPLFIFYLPKCTSKEELTTLFSTYGTVIDVSIPVDRASGETKGFGFVNMQERVDAEKAIRHLNGYLLHGKRLKVAFKNDGKALPRQADRNHAAAARDAERGARQARNTAHTTHAHGPPHAMPHHLQPVYYQASPLHSPMPQPQSPHQAMLNSLLLSPLTNGSALATPPLLPLAPMLHHLQSQLQSPAPLLLPPSHLQMMMGAPSIMPAAGHMMHLMPQQISMQMMPYAWQ